MESTPHPTLVLGCITSMSYSGFWWDRRLACLLRNDRQDACPTKPARNPVPNLRKGYLVSCPAMSLQIRDLASTRVTVIARSEATKQSPALVLELREIASLRSQ